MAETSESRLQQLENTATRLVAYLNDFLPLANTHVADFLTDDCWSRLVPEITQSQLLSLSNSQLAKLPSGELYDITKAKSKASRPEVVKVKNAVARTPWDRGQLPEWRGCDLEDFITEAQSMTLPHLGVLSDINMLLQQWGEKKPEKVFVGEFMSQKKKHEVDIMADVCSIIATHQGLNTVIDIGSGRGYLSSHLTLMHGLSVLAVDSSTVNTHSAQTRSQRLEKHWAGLVRNATNDSSNSKKSKKKKKLHTSICASDLEHVVKKEDSQTANEQTILEVGFGQELTKADVVKIGGDFLEGGVLNSIDTEQTIPNSEVHVRREGNMISNVSTKDEGDTAQCVQITQFITPHTDLQALVKTHLLTSQSDIEDNTTVGSSVSTSLDNPGCCTSKSTTQASCPPAKSVISSSGSKDKASGPQLESTTPSSGNMDKASSPQLESTSPCRGNTNKSPRSSELSRAPVSVLLTGLHTCGNLASSTLDIFTQSKAVQAVCNVGCCYHHLDEAFVQGPFETTGTPAHFGFPLSRLLMSHGFRLGRNARMLASQTPARMANTGQISHESLFYRALLQVMLRDLMGHVSDDWQVGKIFAKSKDFYDYTQRTLKKLNIDDQGKWTREYVLEYERRHAEDRLQLTAFVQLRAALAPIIETLILLDRLLFLHQQENVSEAHLVQMFDPVTSPRCYGLIAFSCHSNRRT